MVKTTTNTDLGKKLDTVIKEVTDMNVILLRHDKSISALEGYRHDTELVEKTIKRVKNEEALARQTKVKDGIEAYQLKSWHLIVGILLVLSAIIYAYATSKGIQP